MRHFTALLALMHVAQIRLGSSFPLTMAPSNRGPKNGTCGFKREKKLCSNPKRVKAERRELILNVEDWR